MTKKSPMPFEGIRITDFGQFWAAPYATGYLASLGAEVIKVESIQRPDTYRFGPKITDDSWEKFAHFNTINVSKLGVTLDLTNPRGIELAKELIKISDVVVDNYSPRVMKNFGLDYDELRKVKPDIIVASLPSYGLTGPWADYVGFAPAFEQASGHASLSGYKDDDMRFLIGGSADPIAGTHAAFAILAALEYRRKTGNGQLIDISQVEACTTLLGPAILDYSMNNRIQGPMGNEDPAMAPHGIFPCKENDTWIAIAIETDADWKVLCRILGRSELADDQNFSNLNERWINQEKLKDIISEWTKKYTPYEAMKTLQNAGIPAGAVNKYWETHEDPHLQDRDYFYKMERAFIPGKQIYNSWPAKFSATKMEYRPAPTLGEHNDYVLSKILKLSKDEIDKLKEENVIGNKPIS